MTDKDIAYAVKYYQEKTKTGGCNKEEFIYKLKKNASSYNPLSSAQSSLWNVINMDMKEIVQRSGKDMAKFARRFCIPYRTLQAWCDKSNECPIYIKLMICEIMGLLRLSRTIEVRSTEMSF